jgi:hypothetical protein
VAGILLTDRAWTSPSSRDACGDFWTSIGQPIDDRGSQGAAGRNSLFVSIIQVRSREEAIQWTKRIPNPTGNGKEGEIEVRQLFELEDFAPSRAIERFRDIGVATKK